MRKVLPLAALLLGVVAGACSDSSPTAGLRDVSSFVHHSRATHVDELIMKFFPKGLETATGKRWDHIDVELGEWDETTGAWSGNVQPARAQLTELMKFVKNKATDIDPLGLEAGEDPNAGAARLALAMFTYTYNGPDATPPALPLGSTDVVFDIVPAGSAALIQTPSKRAGLRLDDGSTLEDRVIAIARHPQEASEEFAARCSGPLLTDRCQYKHFYKFESFPLKRLEKTGRFAVCHVFGSDGPTETEDGYIQLAHNLPADEANYTAGATQEGQIEILPRATTQTGVVSCSEPEVASGIIGVGQRAWYAVAKVAERLIAPKAAYAYDQGPEHNGDFFSDFVGVGAPNFVGTWNGTTRPTGSTGTGQPVTVVITGQSDQGVLGEYRVDQIGEPPFFAYNIREDGLGRFISSSSVGFNGLSFTIDPFFSPFSSGIKLEQTLTRTFNVDGVAVIAGTTTRTSLINGQLVTDTWELSLTKGESELVGVQVILVSLQAAPSGSTANSTTETKIQ